MKQHNGLNDARNMDLSLTRPDYYTIALTDGSYRKVALPFKTELRYLNYRVTGKGETIYMFYPVECSVDPDTFGFFIEIKGVQRIGRCIEIPKKKVHKCIDKAWELIDLVDMSEVRPQSKTLTEQERPSVASIDNKLYGSWS